MKVVLFEPQIPQNTGNIVRTCSASSSGLVLVKPLGFSTSNRMMKRAGLDYFSDITIEEIDHLENYLTAYSSFTFFSSKAKKPYTEFEYQAESLFIFGNETKGLPKVFFDKWPHRFARIPMKKGARCLNLANAVAIVLYECRRQLSFKDLL